MEDDLLSDDGSNALLDSTAYTCMDTANLVCLRVINGSRVEVKGHRIESQVAMKARGRTWICLQNLEVVPGGGDAGSPAPQSPNESPETLIDGMLDIIAENEGIDGENNHLGDHGHLIDADIYEEIEGLEEDETRRKRRNALRDRESLWPGGAVPYVIDGYYNINHKKQILAGMQRFHEKTCIRFVPRTIERDYIFFTQNLGCWSMVGRTGGRQKISLSGTCRGSRGVIMHELMHAIGFRHEHNRPDRDGYIDVYWQNIKAGFTTNFRKYSNDQVQTLGTGYDFMSLMHYPLTAFSNDGKSVTIGPRYPTYQIGDVGNQNDFSHIDIYRINLLYKCGQCEDSDKYYCPIWAMMGECSANKEWMTKYCPFSCDRCTIALRKGDGLACIDTTSNCKRWAKIGECERNPAYMLQNCRRSCKQCKAIDTETGQEDELACQDDNTLCYDWATLGECRTNSKFMKAHCRRSCHVCTGGDGRIIIDTDSDDCQDTTMDCALWAAQNMCKDRQEWMSERCRRTCLWCSHRIVTITDQPDESRVDSEGGIITDETTRAGDEVNRVDDEMGVLGDENSRVGGGETRGRKGEIGASEGEDFGDRTNDEKSSDSDGGSNVEGNPRVESQIHAEGELYGGSVNSTGWIKPQGCVDEHDTCSSWASEGDCISNPEWMAIKCPVSCGLCGDTDIEPACVDRHRNCSYWAMIGECDEYPDWMHVKCPQSCGLCGPQPTAEEIEACADNHLFCKHWAKTGSCDSGHVWLRVHCKKSCDFCSLPKLNPTCMDSQQRCRELALKGECRSNRGWMAYQCPHSCDTCKKQNRFEECRDKTRRCQQYAADGQCHTRQLFMEDVCPYSCGFCRVGKTLRSGRYRTFDPALLGGMQTQTEQNGAGAGNELLPASKRRPHQSLRSRLRLSSTRVNSNNNVNTNENSNNNVSTNANSNTNVSTNDNSNNSVSTNQNRRGRFLTSSGQNNSRECRDRNPQCPTWAKTTRCLVNQGYMQENCQLSCKWCPPVETCVDIDAGCEKWARGGHCLTNEEGLRDKCQKSCGHCGEVEECRDVHRKCREWKKGGWCTRSPLFMRKFCAPSCGLCDENRQGNQNVTVVQPVPETAPVKGKKTKQTKQPRLTKQQKLEQQEQEAEQQRVEQQIRERQRQDDGYIALGLEEVQRLLLNTDGDLTAKQIKSLKRARKAIKQRQQREKELRAIQKKAKLNNLNRETEPIIDRLDEAAVRE
ncbi:uncharacterized protein LOC581452 [Strongylocentrotus purpuratus]|uniref:Metalloendopeptidase n=1 Tax=Strongylocentrotus purpuratus TaxID=7668 RepID=A0A7M7N5C8_STRPU|nr:uncharacterized protein LOC581452 [Strongylocentrotus purpuratus]